MGVMEGLAIALLALALLLFIAEAHAPTTVLGLLGVAALVGAGFAWRDAGHDLPVAAIVVAGVILAGLRRLRLAQGDRSAARRAGPHRLGGAGRGGRRGARAARSGRPDLRSGRALGGRATGESRIGLGNRVRVKAVDGLTLEVEPVADQDPATVEKGA